MLPAQESSVVAEEGQDGHVIRNSEGGAGSPLFGEEDGGGVRGSDERCALQTFEDVAGRSSRTGAAGSGGLGVGGSNGAEGRCSADEAARRKDEREDPHGCFV